MKGWGVVALLVALQPWMSSARADVPKGPALNWVRLPGAEGCITAAELAQRVEARLERKVFVLAPDAELSFDGYVQPRAGGGFSVRLVVSSARGEALGQRELETTEASCRALDDALVLITALTLFPGDFGLQGGIPLDADTTARLHALFGDEPSELDPSTLPEPALPPPAAPPRAVPEPAPAPVPAEVADEPEVGPRAARTRIAIEASSVAAIGVLPGLALGISGEVTLRLPELWPLRAGVAHFFERDEVATEVTSGVGHFERSELSFFACPYAPDAPWAFELCMGSAFGVMRVTSENFADGGVHASDIVLDLGGQAGARALFFDGLLARASLTALLPMIQNSYEYQALDASTETLFRSSQVGLRMQISVGAEF